ncbi:MAG TPA: GNAT family N-acetyltransferase [Bosea sp. (in: a-proteobacteria)]
MADLTTATIRPLTAEDAPAYRALRLSALADTPAAFGASHREEAAQPLDWFTARITPLPPSRVYGVFNGNALIGIAGFLAYGGEKKRHIGLLWGVYVAPAGRGSGIAAALVGAVIAHAREHVLVLHADVGVDNQPAQRLYERLGFGSYGIQPKALRIDGVFHDEAMLALDFTA